MVFNLATPAAQNPRSLPSPSMAWTSAKEGMPEVQPKALEEQLGSQHLVLEEKPVVQFLPLVAQEQSGADERHQRMGEILKQILALLYYPQLDHRLSSHQSRISDASILIVWDDKQ